MKKRHRMWTVLAVIAAVLLVVPVAEAGKKKEKKKDKNKGAAQESVLAWPLTAKLERSLLGYRTAEARGQVARSASGLSEAAQELAWGWILEQEKSYDEAAGRLKKAQNLAPSDPAPSIFLGETYVHANKAGEASSAFKEAERLAQAALRRRPQEWGSPGLAGSGATTPEEVRRCPGGAPEGPGHGSRCRLHPISDRSDRGVQERWEDAVGSLTQAIEKDSGLAYAYYYRGLSAAKIGRKDLMINDLDRFLALALDAPEAATADKLIQSASR